MQFYPPKRILLKLKMTGQMPILPIAQEEASKGNLARTTSLDVAAQAVSSSIPERGAKAHTRWRCLLSKWRPKRKEHYGTHYQEQ